MLTVGSLFSGIGGLDLGLERAGMSVRWQVEIDPFCLSVLEKRWPHVPKYGDIRSLSGDELERVGLICGGFPCQDLSVAGKRAGIEGSRSGLWFEFARIVGVLGPRWVLVENVPGMLDRRAMPRVVGALAGLGYVGAWFCLRAADVGASHLRKRVFIVAYAAGFDRRRGIGCTEAGTGQEPVRRQRPAGQGEGMVADGWCSRLQGFGEAGTEKGSVGREGGTLAGARCQPEHLCWEGLQSEHQAGGADILPEFAPGPDSRLWPEILRERPDLAPALEPPVRGMVDGVPDWLDGAMSNRAKRLRSLGNAVVPQVAEWIGRRILAADGVLGGMVCLR